MFNEAKTVILNQFGTSLRSAVVVSRRGIVNTTPVDDYLEGRAVKVAPSAPLGEGDCILRSVAAGNRRKVEVLFGSVPASLARGIAGFLDIEENAGDSFEAGSCIWLGDAESGAEVASVPGCVCVL